MSPYWIMRWLAVLVCNGIAPVTGNFFIYHFRSEIPVTPTLTLFPRFYKSPLIHPPMPPPGHKKTFSKFWKWGRVSQREWERERERVIQNKENKEYENTTVVCLFSEFYASNGLFIRQPRRFMDVTCMTLTIITMGLTT